MLKIKTRRNDDAFTLVELLVVVTVLVALAAIAIPMFLGQAEKAANAAARSQNGAMAGFVATGMSGPAGSIVGGNGTQIPTDLTTEYGKMAKNGTTVWADQTIPAFCVSTTAPSGQIYVTTLTQQETYEATTGCTSAGVTPAAGATPVALVAAAILSAWGGNDIGQFGDDTTTDSLVPVATSMAGVLSGKTVTQTDASCAVASGEAYCWGWNSDGALGNNSTDDSLVPVAVSTAGVLSGKTVTKISSDESTTCAVADGEAFCWGYNMYGILGNNSMVSESLVPVAVSTAGVLAGKTVTDVSVDQGTACAVASGEAYCWGRNNLGRLGNNSTTLSRVPVAVNTAGVLSGKTVTQITVGWNNACTVASGEAFCWGGGVEGQLGNNSSTHSLVPVAVSTAGVLSGKTVTQLDNTGYFTCAVASGEAFCWGWNIDGQLGNNSTTLSRVPVAVNTAGVLSGKTVTQITGGAGHACAVANGEAFCWGTNFSGQLGNNSLTNSHVPVAVDVSGVLTGKTITAMDAGAGHTTALTS